ncbi:MAG: tetratricopeptide repeat protein [Gammaproteobacteria bacterium]|nr:tetratricopeptide repeat protein [Gammaproteobacteria bacterium]
MPRSSRSLLHIFLALCLATLVACTGGEERQAQYLKRAQEHFDAGNFDKAMVEAKNVLQINSDNVAGRYLLAQLHEQEQNWEQMFANLKLVIDLDPKHVPARIKLGQMFYANALYDETLEQADAVLALQPDNADAHTLRGSVFYKQGNNTAAEAEAELALKTEPTNVGAISVLSAVYGDTDPERALAIIGDGLARQTQNATLQLLKIRVLEQNHREEEALAVYRELVEAYPDNLFYHYRLVRYLEEHGRTDEAEAALRSIVNTSPDNVQLKLWLTQFLANNRNPELAETTLKGFIEQQPKLYELRFALGKLYTAMVRVADARAVYQQIVELDGNGADALLARNKLVELALAEQDQAGADALLAEIFAVEPENSEALITRARIALLARDVKTATGDLRTVLRNAPDNVVALRLLAGAHESEGALDLALDNYRQILGVVPSDHEAAYNVARLALAQGETDAAQLTLESLTEAKPDYVDAQRLLIATLGHQEKWDVALARTEALIANPDTKAMGLYLRGRIQFDRKQYAESAESMEQALALEPAIVEALGFVVNARQQLGEPAVALAYVQAHVAAHPEHAHAYELLGALQQQAGDVAGAQASWRRAIELAPAQLGSYSRLATQLARSDDWDGATAVLQAAIDANPRSADLQVALGELLLERQKVDEALAAYEAALRLQPNMPVAANNLAAIIADHRTDEPSLRRALALAQPLEELQQPAFLDTLAWVNYRLGNSARTVSLLNAAIGLGGDAPVYHYHLGMAYHSQNQLELAREHLSLAVATTGAAYPGREEAERVLNTL